MEIETSLIRVPKTWRVLDEAAMPGLIDSINTIGLLHPITVIETITGKYELAAGRHRLEAYMRLGRKIDVMSGNSMMTTRFGFQLPSRTSCVPGLVRYRPPKSSIIGTTFAR